MALTRWWLYVAQASSTDTTPCCIGCCRVGLIEGLELGELLGRGSFGRAYRGKPRTLRIGPYVWAAGLVPKSTTGLSACYGSMRAYSGTLACRTPAGCAHQTRSSLAARALRFQY